MTAYAGFWVSASPAPVPRSPMPPWCVPNDVQITPMNVACFGGIDEYHRLQRKYLPDYLTATAKPDYISQSDGETDMSIGYSPEAEQWVEVQRRISAGLVSELANNGVVITTQAANEKLETIAGQMATRQLSHTRKTGSTLIRKSAANNRPLAPRGYAFCPSNKEAVRLTGEKQMAMGGVVGTCPSCGSIHYRES